MRKIEQRDIKAELLVQHKVAGALVNEKTTTEKVGEVVSERPMANVGVSLAHTKNLGNYESVKVQVSLHIPCEDNEIDKSFEYVKDWVDTKIANVVTEIENDLG